MASEVKLTKWCKEMYRKYKSGTDNAFIICGNIGDYTVDTVKLNDYLDVILKAAFKMDRIISYTPTKNCYTQGNDNNRVPVTVEYITKNLTYDRTGKKHAYIINYANLVLPDTMNGNLQNSEKTDFVAFHDALTSSRFMSSDDIVIFICESTKDINRAFLSSNIKTSVINITLPDFDERLEFIEYSINSLQVPAESITITTKQMANLTAGLSRINIEDILLVAMDKGKLTPEMILARKEELIRKEYGDIVEILDTEGASLENFAGQEHIKAYFKDVVIDAIKEDNIKIIPKGVLLMGPPGTGKTYFSTCLAGDAGINFVEFKMSKVLDKWVGEAEKNLEKAFSVFRAMAPVGVFIDEIDQALSRGDNDSNSVNKNLFGMFLHELSKPENRGKIIWLGATNYPNKIDEALKRSGRFDKKIPFFAPSSEEREAVFKIHLRKTKFNLSDDIDTKVLAEKTEGYTQAEIENIVVKSLELTMRHHKEEISMDELNLALEYMLSAQNNRIKEMEDIALIECNDLEFLPEKYRERRKELMRRNNN